MKAVSIKPMRIIVFAKAPTAGFAKTRLIPELGAAGAAALARLMLAHTLRAALAANIGRVELCVTPAIADEAWHGVELPLGITIADQGDEAGIAVTDPPGQVDDAGVGHDAVAVAPAGAVAAQPHRPASGVAASDSRAAS